MKQSIQESIPQFILKLIISTVIYFKLSIFQKHHAQERVWSKAESEKKKFPINSQDKFVEQPMMV